MSDNEYTTFTPDSLADALRELGALAHDAGRIIDIAVYGGSCLMLVSNFRLSTGDVDAVAAEDQGFLDYAAQSIAGRRGWPRDLWDQYQRREQRTADDAPRYLGRSGAAG